MKNFKDLDSSETDKYYDEIENIFENIKTDQTHNNQLDMEIYNNLLRDELSFALQNFQQK